MTTVAVYRFDDFLNGEYHRSLSMATRDFLKRIPSAKEVPNSEMLVDDSLLDGNGLIRIKTKESILNSLPFKELRPGVTDNSFSFSGSGLVTIWRDVLGSQQATLVSVLCSDIDAYADATKLLLQFRTGESNEYARLFVVNDKHLRRLYAEILSRF